ncbi:aspartate/glutamate racemase family protein [Leucobacter chromiireducens]|uniref:aspartate/glutamate racemase family protein n=1 Tax=Leucobacter chromiireducens TaxID=283877 RepID=UPI0019CFCFA9|nr:amino acid racemase [Leucobacter chromiireducens]
MPATRSGVRPPERSQARGPEAAVIGVLGGMGPAATADFYRKIVQATPAERDQDHLRTIIWSDPSIPDRATAFLHGGESPVAALIAGARRLEDAGAGFLAVPCNTAHLFLDQVRDAVGIPILDMVGATVAELHRTTAPGSRIAVLGTAATRASGLYARRLRSAAFLPLEPSDTEQQAVSAAIAEVKRGAEAAAGQVLAPVIEAFVRQGASTVIAGCSELPIAWSTLTAVPPVTDPTTALARACVAHAAALPTRTASR